MSSKKLLFVNLPLSGINRYLIDGLEARGWQLETVPMPIPPRFRYQAMATTFRLPRAAWSQAYYDKVDRYTMSTACFMARTKYCQRELARRQGDLVFQISGLYAPSLGELGMPYVTYNDYTMKLSWRKYRQWAPFRDETEAQTYFAQETRLYQGAARIFATSENTRQSMIQDYGVNPGNVIAAGNGLPLDTLPELRDRHYDGKTILFIGKEFERKGGPTLLAAFAKLRQRLPEARLRIAGLSAPLVEAEGVEWLGMIRDRQQISQLYMSSSLFVMPSVHEPFGLVFLEAMIHGVPCIGTDTDAMPEIIQDGVSGLIVPVGDADALANAMEELLSHPKRLADMGQAGAKHVRERYLWDRILDRIHPELLEVVG